MVQPAPHKDTTRNIYGKLTEAGFDPWLEKEKLLIRRAEDYLLGAGYLCHRSRG